MQAQAKEVRGAPGAESISTGGNLFNADSNRFFDQASAREHLGVAV